MEHKSSLLMQISNKQESTNWKNILVAKYKDLVHFEIPPVDYLTRNFILTPVESSRPTPTRKVYQLILV